MKLCNYKKSILFTSVLVFIVSCTVTHFERSGKIFDKDKVSLIIKGQTTRKEILDMFGEPHDKYFTQTAQEKWVYLYQEMTAEVSRGRSWLYGMAKQHGVRRIERLEILYGQISKEVVNDYLYSESEIPFSHGHNVGGGGGYMGY